jgi:hypothetical protein
MNLETIEISKKNGEKILMNAAIDKSTEEALEIIDTEKQKLNTDIEESQVAINRMTNQKDALVKSITSALESGTDESLTTSGVAADAKATGDKIDALIEVTSTEPTNTTTKLWLNTTVEEGYEVPEINDSEESDVDTWSSKKIAEEIGELREEINTLLNVGTSVFGDGFTITADNDVYSMTSDSNAVLGALLFKTNKIKLSSLHDILVFATNEQYGRYVYINLANGEIWWQKRDVIQTTAKIDTISIPAFSFNDGLTIETDGNILRISDETNDFEIDVTTINNWNATLYSDLCIGVELNQYYVQGYPVATILDYFNKHRKEVKNIIEKYKNENDILYGKKIVLLGDSYIDAPGISDSETWHYLLAEKYNMTRESYGISGNCIVFDNSDTTSPMVERYTEMPDDADIIIVQGGKNDFNFRSDSRSADMNDEQFIEAFRNGLVTLCMGLIKKYRHRGTTIIFGTPWSFPCDDTAIEGVYIPYSKSSGYTIPIQKITDTIIEVCNQFSIPVFDCSRTSGVYLWSKASDILDSWQYDHFIKNDNGYPDYSHLNAEGQKYILPKWEKIIKLYAQY